MSSVIPFPSAAQAFGETFSSVTLRAGSIEAERRGITRDQITIAMEQNRQLVTYFLGLLGSANEQDRQGGALGLTRLLGVTGGAA
ncbi:hypothetical protein [Methylobacterium nonmethylotrophicum]|uniref:Uncharacterized protein n=1 Tax=Methylobacterium nonmethylotrophicum TaxID=1141884 RepID=A0A4Z0NEB7_9HYPH|nr:hypothetical protein [Methylobacterium nonmethylotrophicum]TGD91805.1 hypothetical protein EU555_35505 [Methylobacterium nonmethylotrophicum]